MESLNELYRIGMGPSSSHTMGPRRAALQFAERTPTATAYRVVLQGSLAATGKGHLTDRAILDALPKPCELHWAPEEVPDFHPNGMLFTALDADGNEIDHWHIFSVGGGALREPGQTTATNEIYPLGSAVEILHWCDEQGAPVWACVDTYESGAGIDIDAHLHAVWQTMRDAVHRGLHCETPIPGVLHLARRAHLAFLQSKRLHPQARRTALIAAYALAASEENASGGVICTAPTCGSAGVIPGLFTYLKSSLKLEDIEIHRALKTAGLFGNLIKRNASISGAEVGCQGEVGSACAMAAAGAAQILGGTAHQIEAAAEMALEHHLGLTCDPIAGLVQIPCIERNAMGAIRALDCAEYALLFDGRHRVSFDQVVETMKRTGMDLPSLYRETAAGGLAVVFGMGC